MDSKEKANRKGDLFSDTKAAIHKLWEIFWANDDNSEPEKRLNEITDQRRLNMWLEADVKDALKRSRMARLPEIREIVNGLEIDLDRCITDAEIRLDFAKALRNVKNGTKLSGKLGWSFAPDDLMNLMVLHKSNKFRRKIEDLLEDCNFHSECGLLAEKKYDEFERYVMSED